MKSKNHIFLIELLFLLLCLPLCLAEIQNLGTFKQYGCITLVQSCSNCSWNNITSILYPDSSQALAQVAMTKTGTNYNYSNFCNTTILGQYIVNGKGDVDGITTVWAYNFNITPTGGDRLNSLGIFTILILVSIALLGMAMMFKNGYVGFIAGCLFLITGIYTMIYGLGNLNDDWTRAVSYTILGMGLIFCVSTGMQIIRDVGYGIGPERDEN